MELVPEELERVKTEIVEMICGGLERGDCGGRGRYRRAPRGIEPWHLIESPIK